MRGDSLRECSSFTVGDDNEFNAHGAGELIVDDLCGVELGIAVWHDAYRVSGCLDGFFECQASSIDSFWANTASKVAQAQTDFALWQRPKVFW